jgi:hypothetical protein
MRMMAFVLFLTAVCYISAHAAQDETNRVFDCGVNAVYLVRRLKSMDADLNEISGKLLRDAEQGSSIHDIETYLHGAGIRTDARKMRLSGLAKNRGSLAVLLLHKHGADQSGHFVAARAVGNGRLQIIDSLTGAAIDEGATRSREQLPIILIDPPEREWAWMLWAGMSAALLGFLAYLMKTEKCGGKRGMAQPA